MAEEEDEIGLWEKRIEERLRSLESQSEKILDRLRLLDTILETLRDHDKKLSKHHKIMREG